ncbi:MAG: helix-turn-helix domain-containing protein [Elusimicrobiota bacterium]|nr:helix-turn-helix domain-containing protein [Elusimicrobiota bacterium]
MSKRKTDILYEKGTGLELFTSREAARFLDYHPVAFRNLVSKGKIHIHSRTGNYPLFLREELEKYQTTNKWAGKKANLKTKPDQPPAHTSSRGILAVVTATHKRKEIVIENLTGFKWEDVPAIRARVAAKYGKIPFRITLELPDDTGFTIVFHPSAKRADTP